MDLGSEFSFTLTTNELTDTEASEKYSAILT